MNCDQMEMDTRPQLEKVLTGKVIELVHTVANSMNLQVRSGSEAYGIMAKEYWKLSDLHKNLRKDLQMVMEQIDPGTDLLQATTQLTGRVIALAVKAVTMAAECEICTQDLNDEVHDG